MIFDNKGMLVTPKKETTNHYTPNQIFGALFNLIETYNAEYDPEPLCVPKIPPTEYNKVELSMEKAEGFNYILNYKYVGNIELDDSNLIQVDDFLGFLKTERLEYLKNPAEYKEYTKATEEYSEEFLESKFKAINILAIEFAKNKLFNYGLDKVLEFEVDVCGFCAYASIPDPSCLEAPHELTLKEYYKIIFDKLFLDFSKEELDEIWYEFFDKNLNRTLELNH